MGRRFWGCPKFEVGKVGNACDFFHFLDGDEVIEERAKDLLLRLKDKQIRLEKEIQSYKEENENLMAEKGKLLQENANLMSENGKFLTENGDLKVQCEAFVKNIKGLEKKVKRNCINIVGKTRKMTGWD
ncbi:hypothetical protein SLEP1_g23461 [Rubroshorea leprosula]|uniref:C3H1-type domain-containing protein n=1 Tax=Rubroshorea leprosula TaxID=152421 RepID=A0AAV5JCG3_9ROSI|nr:hypothetical protein SLEP1_g23461 [Rubroshorea leprosula]